MCGVLFSILKYLLFHAKVKLQKVGDNSGVGLCDQYLARLDLLTLLVKDNCPYIPSMQQLTKVEILRYSVLSVTEIYICPADLKTRSVCLISS